MLCLVVSIYLKSKTGLRKQDSKFSSRKVNCSCPSSKNAHILEDRELGQASGGMVLRVEVLHVNRQGDKNLVSEGLLWGVCLTKTFTSFQKVSFLMLAFHMLVRNSCSNRLNTKTKGAKFSFRLQVL